MDNNDTIIDFIARILVVLLIVVLAAGILWFAPKYNVWVKEQAEKAVLVDIRKIEAMDALEKLKEEVETTMDK